MFRKERIGGDVDRSSLYYWAHYDFHNNTHFGEPIPGTACDETFTAWRSSQGSLRSPLNTLVFKPGGSSTSTQRGPPVLAPPGTTPRPYGYTGGSTSSLYRGVSSRFSPTSAPVPALSPSSVQDILCTYRFITDLRLFARITLYVESINFKVKSFAKVT